jgi:hypothetical protein
LTDRSGLRVRLNSALAITVAVCVLGTVLALRTAGASTPDPTANLTVGPLPAACYEQPDSAACEGPIVGYLDAAREAAGLGAYRLPADFTALGPDRQLLILVNLDRRAYGLPLISGLSPQLDAAAATGASIEQDPAAPTADRAVWASAWAAGLVNVLAAYYQWMYADGFGGLNIDCPSPAAPGCWVHRHGILFEFGRSVRLTMGAAVVSVGGRQVVGMLIAATGRARGPAEDYTWADAEADGAGRDPQVAGPAAGPRPPARPRITRAEVSSTARTATFRFTGQPGARFECALVPASSARPATGDFSACRSPARYSGLRSATIDFFVRTTASSDAGHSATAERRFVIAG